MIATIVSFANNQINWDWSVVITGLIQVCIIVVCFSVPLVLIILGLLYLQRVLRKSDEDMNRYNK